MIVGLESLQHGDLVRYQEVDEDVMYESRFPSIAPHRALLLASSPTTVWDGGIHFVGEGKKKVGALRTLVPKT